MSDGDGATADLLDELAILVRRDALLTWSSQIRNSAAREDLDDVKEVMNSFPAFDFPLTLESSLHALLRHAQSTAMHSMTYFLMF